MIKAVNNRPRVLGNREMVLLTGTLRMRRTVVRWQTFSKQLLGGGPDLQYLFLYLKCFHHDRLQVQMMSPATVLGRNVHQQIIIEYFHHTDTRDTKKLQEHR